MQLVRRRDICLLRPCRFQIPALKLFESCQNLSPLSPVDARNGEPIDAEVQVISLGKDIAWVSMQGEIFVQLGLAIKEGSPFVTTTISELANGSVGYVSTRQAYAQGNYEVVSARCSEGCGEMLVDSALQQLRGHFVYQSEK